MAIPTQFSVANTNIAPIANPPLAKDLPKVIDAEEHSLVDGASIIPPLASIGVNAPVELSAESAVVIANPSTKTAQSKVSVDAPVEKTAESKVTTSPPSALTPNAGTQTSGTFPLNHARILYRNTLRINQGISTNNGLGGADTLKPNTWESWEFTNGGEIIFTLTDARLMDTVCIGAHNIGSLGASVGVEHSAAESGDDFVATFPGQNPTTDAAIMFHRQSKVNVRRLKIIISGTGDFEVGYISAGTALQMQRPFFNGHKPYTDSDVTEYYSNRSESGEIIGRLIRSRGYETTYEWQNIDDEWYRDNIPLFKEAVKTFPFFIAWNLLEYPEDVGFGETTGDISTTMQNGTRTKRSGLSFTLRGV